VYISRIWGEETPGRIVSKFCLVIETQDVITCIKFGDDRLRRFWSAGCQSSPFPIDFDRRPYNSATLPRALWCLVSLYACNILTAYSDLGQIEQTETGSRFDKSATPQINVTTSLKRRWKQGTCMTSSRHTSSWRHSTVISRCLSDRQVTWSLWIVTYRVVQNVSHNHKSFVNHNRVKNRFSSTNSTVK